MRSVLLCILLALPASAAPLDHLLRTPPWELREGDAAAALAPTLDLIRAADRAAVDAWVAHPGGEGPLGPRELDAAAAALSLTGFAHPEDPLAELPDPDLEPLRTLGRLLAAEGIRRGREDGWGAAAGPLRAAVRLGHHLGRAPGLTRVLVGVAVHQRVVQALEALAGESEIPNLHDTLADLANQRIDVLPAAWTQLARPALNDPLVQEARDAVDHPEDLTDADWDHLRFRLVFAFAVGEEPDPQQPFPALQPEVLAALEAAQLAFGEIGRRLVSRDAPASQHLITGVLHIWDELRAEAWEATLLPYHEFRAGWTHFEQPSLLRPPADLLLLPFVSWPLPALAGAADLDRRLAALRGAEALRLHASREGRFPAALADCEPAVPVDPFTGEWPLYEVAEDGSTATLDQEDLPGDTPERSFTHRLEAVER